MEKYYFEQELREAALIKSSDKSTAIVLNGEEIEIYCTEFARGNITEEGMPCLISESKIPGNGKFEVMAFSLDSMMTERKWIVNIFLDNGGKESSYCTACFG